MVQNEMKKCHGLLVHFDFSRRQRFAEHQGKKTVAVVDSALEMFEGMFGRSKAQIAEALEGVSGDVNDLLAVLEKGDDESIRWTKEDDDLLRNIRSKDDPIFQVFARLKNTDRIKRRC